MNFRDDRRSCLLLGVAVLVPAGLTVAVGLVAANETGVRWSPVPTSTSTSGSPSVAAPAPEIAGATRRPAEGSAPTAAGAPAGSASTAHRTPTGKPPPGPASALAAAGDCAFYPQLALPAALLSWTVGAPAGDSQRVELSSVPRGFDSGRFSSSQPLPGDQAVFAWRDITAGRTYTWRVVTVSGSASSTSPSHTFVGEPCLRGGSGETP